MFIITMSLIVIGLIIIHNLQISILMSVVLLPVVYTFFEYIWQQTPGKMIMNIVVIDQYAQNPDFKTCLLRSIIRMIPFEAFSCMGSRSRGWHDRWTKTYVVPKDRLLSLQELVKRETPVIQ
ncbi:MAG: RDD family protein [Cytophagales bacterium]|nr:RDD family protein [Cytophaga sp.]